MIYFFPGLYKHSDLENSSIYVKVESEATKLLGNMSVWVEVSQLFPGLYMRKAPKKLDYDDNYYPIKSLEEAA